MHKDTVDSSGIEDLFEYWSFNTADDCDRVGGAGSCVNLANLYMRQKSILVDGRHDLVTMLITLTGFSRLTTTVKKTVDGVEKTISVPDETEAEYIGRLKKAVLSKELVHPKIDGTSESTYAASVRALAHQLGPYICNSAKAVREAKEKKLADTWVQAARQIIARGAARVAFWKNVFQNGDDNVTTPTAFEPFDTVAPKDTTPEEVAKVMETNVINLGWAVKAYDAQLSKGRYI
jgi:hypothetical protein